MAYMHSGIFFLHLVGETRKYIVSYYMSCCKFSFFMSTLTCIMYTIHRIILGKIPTQDGSINAYTFISDRWVGISL
jgi:hypothetical protein